LPELSAWWLAYPALGLFAGFFAGLLGIGGGLILVTVLVMLFDAQGFPADRVMHLALGTSLATIVFTSLKSARSHHGHGAVRWDIVRNTVAGLVVGTLAGSVVAEHLRSTWLALLFLGFVIYSAVHMMLDIAPRPSRRLPGPWGLQFGAAVVGVLSALVGAGGGFVSIPLMAMCNVPMRQCVGTSSALGLPIALAGAIGYVAAGWNKDHLPALSVGYVYLPALAGIVVGTFVTVPMGAKLAHALPVAKLKKVFAAVLALLAVKMLYGLL
jgi:uncharacterized membrane protein YfcA